jgi:hypothetical protein
VDQPPPELTRLAAVLGVAADDLDFLVPVGVEALRAVLPLVLDHLYAAEYGRLRRLAAAGRLMPASLSARIAVRAIPPTLAAAMVATIEPDKAVGVAARLPADYLADCAVVMDPRTVTALVPRLPLGFLVSVLAALTARGEFALIAGFLPELDDDRLTAMLASVPEGELAQILAHVADPTDLDRVAVLSPRRIDGAGAP